MVLRQVAGSISAPARQAHLFARLRVRRGAKDLANRRAAVSLPRRWCGPLLGPVPVPAHSLSMLGDGLPRHRPASGIFCNMRRCSSGPRHAVWSRFPPQRVIRQMETKSLGLTLHVEAHGQLLPQQTLGLGGVGAHHLVGIERPQVRAQAPGGSPLRTCGGAPRQ